jgi:hypothetical protein
MRRCGGGCNGGGKSYLPDNDEVRFEFGTEDDDTAPKFNQDKGKLNDYSSVFHIFQSSIGDRDRCSKYCDFDSSLQ